MVPPSKPHSSSRQLNLVEENDDDENMFEQALANIKAVKRESMRLLQDSPNNSNSRR